MAFKTWQLGMEIDRECLRALAVTPERRGWHLRGWWQLPLPSARDGQGDPCPTTATCRTLRHWRRQLPWRLSLRLCLPTLAVTLTRLPAPDRRLPHAACGGHLEWQLRRRQPDTPAALAYDWYPDPSKPSCVIFISARQPAIEAWRRCLHLAGFTPHRLDIVPCALRRMARLAGLRVDLPLMHLCAAGSYRVAALREPLNFSLTADPPSAPLYYCSGDTPLSLAEGRRFWSPFVAFTERHEGKIYSVLMAMGRGAALRCRQMGRPQSLPARPSAWAIAGGLAVAREDSRWSR